MEGKFDYSKREEEIYKNWEESGYFKCDIDKSKKPFTIVMPPPNVTGRLHMGHALVNTIQDIFIRYNRMKGIPSLWIPGTDHASIATEVKVVEKLKSEGKTKEELGREGFLKEAWEWKEKYGGEITKQLRQLGCSCDWEKERFTMDEGCSKAVLKVFVDLYNKGLIYRGTRLVNWCPDCKTSVSDIEVDYEEKDSFLWHIKYPIENSDKYLIVATTRPETMLGDTAVAVNPNDDRYKDIIGKRVMLPLTDKYIQIIADEYVETDFGTGVVKITPAHDPNDFEVGRRHNLEIINILNSDGTLNENAYAYQGQDRFEARKNIVSDLEKLGLIEKIEPYKHNVGTCYRCHNIVEPYMSLQWFVKMDTLAEPAIEAVKNEEIKFLPKRFEKNYFNWMENIQDWCISRQLWWGHRIPAYYCEECGKVIVSETAPEKCECGGKLKQDEDTLDTWFSSALWPFSVFGWPDDTEDYEYFYPTSTLVTAYDILTFWVSKMIFSGIAYTGKIPFDKVYMHGLVRDAQGRKMSKSLGNGVDPLDVIKDFGTDALRFSLIQGISQGNDVRYIPEKVDAARNFSNKLWNAAKFVNMYIADLDVDNVDNFTPEDKWILNKLSNTVEEVTLNMDKYEIGVAIQQIYDFIWFDFCDWYIEMVKPRLYNKESETYKSAIWTLNYVLTSSVKLLHPYMPYITEEIYQNLKDDSKSIMISNWPTSKYKFDETEYVEEFMEIIRQIRNVRTNNKIPNSKKIDIKVPIVENNFCRTFSECEEFIKKLACVGDVCYIKNEDDSLNDSVSINLKDISVYLDLSNIIDKDEELKKLGEEKKVILSELNRAKGMLSNPSFVEKAPQNLIDKEKEKIEKYQELLEKVEDRISKLN